MLEQYKTPSVLALLWLRLTSLSIIGLVFVEALELASGKVQGWSFYLTPSELIFEGAMRLIIASILGIVVGTSFAIMLFPLIWLSKSSRRAMVERTTEIAVIAVMFLDCRIALWTLIKWSYQFAEHRGIIDTAIWAAFYLAFSLAICFPATRKALVSSLYSLLGERGARRIPLVALASIVALVSFELMLAKAAVPPVALASEHRPQTNLLLVTFDALSAEDMSLYGYKLTTTPRIDAFARTAVVFKNFYSASSFTTPCVATIMTGMYPSQSHVHHLHGELNDPAKTLPHALRSGGYATAAFFSNPSAHYLAQTVKSELDYLPEPVYLPGAMQHLWSATALLHPPVQFGNRADEYSDLVIAWSRLVALPINSHEGYPAATTFQQARKLLNTLPQGFFLWVHVMTPHAPYLPDARERGHFLDANVSQFFDGQREPKWTPNYDVDQQSKVDEYRLRYDEFIVNADREFGSFLDDLEARGTLQNTTVIVSADHGESFEGGVYQHGGPYLTRPVIHVPLIIKTPGQRQGREVATVADQTALAPTILNLLGVQKADWMAGESLASRLNPTETAAAKGLAFTQYFEKNSIYKPLTHGAIGVVDGQYQYVFDLDAQKGKLRSLKDAHHLRFDESAESPAKAKELLTAIYSHFPEIRRTR